MLLASAVIALVRPLTSDTDAGALERSAVQLVAGNAKKKQNAAAAVAKKEASTAYATAKKDERAGSGAVRRAQVRLCTTKVGKEDAYCMIDAATRNVYPLPKDAANNMKPTRADSERYRIDYFPRPETVGENEE